MRDLASKLAAGLAVVTLSASTAAAQHPPRRLVAYRHVHHRLMGYVGYESSAPYYRKSQQIAPLPYVPAENDYGPGAAVLRATIRAQAEPGVTNELAPDSAQTATGGPVGGIPGFSGGGGGR